MSDSNYQLFKFGFTADQAMLTALKYSLMNMKGSFVWNIEKAILLAFLIIIILSLLAKSKFN